MRERNTTQRDRTKELASESERKRESGRKEVMGTFIGKEGVEAVVVDP